MYAGLVLSAHMHNKYCQLVKVVNNATLLVAQCLAASYPQTGIKSRIELEFQTHSLDLVQRESQCVFG